ncbi:MAG: type 1 glutamine amidotransferase [Proteobacteria bacterium]|nr:type 1 glutamine amidotransferase [Pseudomonadota bacterium]
MARKFLVFQHNEWEVPGEYVFKSAAKNNVLLDVCRVWEEKIPSLSPYDCLMVLGGGPNVDQEDVYPFLTEEKRVIRQSLAEDRPYLGFCLGHQLLAEAMGAEVGPNHQASIGFITGFVTHNGYNHPVLANLPCCLPIFKWHRYAVQEPLPRHLEILLTSRECQIEAISVVNRPHIVGFQFDNQSAAPNDVAKWLIHDREWLNSLPDPVNPGKVLSAAEKCSQETGCEFELIFDNYLRTIENMA